MKADILRRAEEIFPDEDVDGDHKDAAGRRAAKSKERSTLVFDDDDDDGHDDDDTLGAVKVIGDGEASSGSEAEENGEDEDNVGPVQRRIEMMLELAYIRDPKLFERDAATRRGKARVDLRALTGMLFFLYIRWTSV